MLSPELLNYLKQFGHLGLFFLLWYFDRKSLVDAQRAIREELKESNRKWYELGQRMERHTLTNTGAVVELREKTKTTHDKLDVLLRRKD